MRLKLSFIALVILLTLAAQAIADPDPNFHIYWLGCLAIPIICISRQKAIANSANVTRKKCFPFWVTRSNTERRYQT